jgi:hypothetical protein
VVHFATAAEMLDFFRLPKDGRYYRRLVQGFQRLFAATIFFGAEDRADPGRLIDWARFHFFDELRLWDKRAAHRIGFQRGEGRGRKSVGDIDLGSDNSGLWDPQERERMRSAVAGGAEPRKPHWPLRVGVVGYMLSVRLESIMEIPATCGGGAHGSCRLNMTRLCKQSEVPCPLDLSADLLHLPAVNGVVFRDGRRYGHNIPCRIAKGGRCGVVGLGLLVHMLAPVAACGFFCGISGKCGTA